MGRIILAGLLGGFAMFVWTSFAHLSTPLGTMGVSELPAEESVLAALQTATGDKNAFYIFPGMRLPPKASPEEQAAAMKTFDDKSKYLPSGIVVINPPGNAGMTPARLIGEFVNELVQAMVLAFVLGLTTLTGFLPRLGLGAAVGAAAAVSTNVSYFVWYGFPLSYTIGYALTGFIAYVVASAVILLVVRRA